LKAQNNTNSTLYWETQAGVSGFKNYVNGMARIIKYYRSYAVGGAPAENLVLVEVLEGEVEAGAAKGFVRKIKSARGTSFIGDLDGDKPLGKGCYFADYELVHQGKWSSEQTSYTDAPATEMRFQSFDPLDNQVVVDESELADGRMDQAYTLAYAFLAEVGMPPQWGRYGDGPATRIVRSYYEDEEVGGGPLTNGVLVDGWYMEVPLAEDFWTYMTRIAEAAYDGQEMGGYVRIGHVDMGDGMYCDMWLYSTAGEAGYEYLRSVNGTDYREDGGSLMWADVAEHVTGLARLVVYEELINPYATSLTSAGAAEPEYLLVSMFEGAVKNGMVNAKFGRLMTRDGDNFIGYLAGDPATQEWGAIGKGIWFRDLFFQARGFYNTTDAMGLPFDAAHDSENPDNFVCWDFWSFERESIPYEVMFDEESGCRWNDASCFYWAYQYNSGWGGDSALPDHVRYHPYY